MISAVVSGSFKFKPEIDKAIETLEETGIKVLEPTRGWIIMPPVELAERLLYGQIRPLPTEERLTTRQIEDRFLRALGKASLLYLMNPEGYIGKSAGFELGYAIGLDKALYCLEPINYEAMEIDDLAIRKLFEHTVTVLPPEQVASHYQDNFQKT